MKDSNFETTLQLCQDIVALLAPYEEDLLVAEANEPSLGFLRRAVGMVIAEACYRISDDKGRIEQGFPRRGDAPPPAG